MKKILPLLLTTLIGCGIFNKPLERPIPPGKFNINYSDKVLMNFYAVYSRASIEIPMCMFGKKVSTTKYEVNSVDFPVIFYSDERSSSFNHDNCLERSDYLGMVHNHLHTYNVNECYPSDVDLDRFFHEEKATLESVICYPHTGPYIKTLSKDMLPENYLIEFEEYMRNTYTEDEAK